MNFIQAISAIPPHLQALGIIFLGVLIALFGGRFTPEAFVLGSSLVTAGLAIYRTPDPVVPDAKA